jgi:hypothetical protein
MLGEHTLDVEESPADAARLLWDAGRTTGYAELHVREALVFVNPATVAYVIDAGEPHLRR